MPAFGLRCRPSGHKSWIVRYRERGMERFKTLGSVPKMTARQARREALRILQEVALDGLPQKPKERPGKGLTFEEFAAEFIGLRKGGWKPSTTARNEHALRRDILPFFGSIAVAAGQVSDVARWRDAMAHEPAMFNRAVPVLSAMFQQAELLGYRKRGSNPCKGIARYKRKLLERYLSPAEYRALAAVLREGEREYPAAVQLIRLLIYTGARVGEIAGLEWEWVKPPRIFLPDSKTGAKVVYLNAPAAAILDDLRGENATGLIFPSRRRPSLPYNVNPAWMDLRTRAGLSNVRLHDLRHSFASVAIRDGIPLTLISKLLGHALPETTARYAHLADDVVSEAAARVCASIAGKMEPTA
ncbi:site-specific integrase [Novosphingobium sp. JCM 18896]|nr:site-specific integrase [Novosphingobium sp. JCM 18896]MCW1432010.1 site-specific integrase [Novosphingobium sp. JCM 18896]